MEHLSGIHGALSSGLNTHEDKGERRREGEGKGRMKKSNTRRRNDFPRSESGWVGGGVRLAT